MGRGPRYSIGIDLGTTNCALSYVDLAERNAESQVMPVVQLAERLTVVELTTLPSFLALPAPHEKFGADGEDDVLLEGWLVGLEARNRAKEAPDRVVHSAKSWLCHHTVSSDAAILPWKSATVADSEKLSPLAASAKLLRYLREAWNARFDSLGAEHFFERQSVTVTVPASFDAAAQAATLSAARQARYPEGTRLLEEPQAAFYRWLEAGRHGGLGKLKEGSCALVVDIGGGTSDFSLFRVAGLGGSGLRVERIAVSEHLLLGGDNIDLALAHALESEVTGGGGEELSVDQWGHLIARARELKERCLGYGLSDEATLSVSVPSRGSGLFAGSLSAEVSSADVRNLLLDGFFPACSANERPDKGQSGLLEWGLPYAPDCAVTRYLAEFLAGKPAVDAVLFNGGSLAAPLVRERLLNQLTQWQESSRPEVLENEETDLAVARGAAYYGALLHGKERRIEAGAARAVYLEAAASGEGEAGKLVCILPQGAQPGSRHLIDLPGLRLAVNRPARFQVYQGGEKRRDPAGAVVDADESFKRLPALQTKVELSGSAEDEQRESVRVALVSEMNEVGLLTVLCESREDSVPGSWPLEFNVRAAAEAPGAARESSAKTEPRQENRLDSRAFGRAKDALIRQFSGAREVKASQVLKELERSLRCSRHEWDLGIARGLADALLPATHLAERSESHRESWLQLTGFLLRPGFGAVDDQSRLERVWSLADDASGESLRVETQRLIMLRRLAGGLFVERQNAIFDRQFEALLRSKKALAERIRLLGSLERARQERKQKLVDLLVERLRAKDADDRYIAPTLAALGAVLNRTPFHAGPSEVLPPENVATAFDALSKRDWTDPRYTEAITLFLKAARIVDDRALNLPNRLSKKIVAKLDKSGVAASRLAPLIDFVPLSREERVRSYGESLPPGLVLT